MCIDKNKERRFCICLVGHHITDSNISRTNVEFFFYASIEKQLQFLTISSYNEIILER